VARDFTKNASNYMGIGIGGFGNLISGASAVSMHAIISPDSTSGVAGGNDDRVLSSLINGSGTSGLYLGLESTAEVRVAGRSQTSDTFHALNGTTQLTFGSWAAVGGVLDFNGDAIRVYVNGSQEASAAKAFSASSYALGTPTEEDSIGGLGTPPATADQFDGRIAELAVWRSDIGTAGYLQLSKGISPLLVSPSTLVFYMRLIGQSTEVDIVGGVKAVITGSIPVTTHPRVIYPTLPYYPGEELARIVAPSAISSWEAVAPTVFTGISPPTISPEIIFGEPTLVNVQTTLIVITGSLYSAKTGDKITYGQLRIKPQTFNVLANNIIAPMTILVDVPSSGNLLFYLAPSAGVKYVVEFDPDPNDKITPLKLKSGYFKNMWTIPDTGPVNISTL
jgi:hypothetical protein